MATITRSQVINRRVEEVFAAVIDGGNFAEWNPTVRASRRLDEGEIGEGTRFEWDLRGFGKVIQELRELQPNQRVRIVPRIKTLEGGTASISRPTAMRRASTTSSRCARRGCSGSSRRSSG